VHVLPYAPTYRWSPRGLWLAMVQGVEEDAALSIIDPNGSAARLLANDFVDVQWSPDGEWIYTQPVDNTGVTDLKRIHAASGRSESLITGRIISNLSWSPDGAQVVLVIATDDASQLFTMRPDGSAMTALPVDLPSPRIRAPRWSPDGAWIAFEGGENFSERYIYRIRPDGSDLQRLAWVPALVRDLQWSSDGRWLLFSVDLGDNIDIFRLRSDGSTMQNLTPGPGDSVWPQYAPTAGMRWHPLPLTLAALGMVFAPFLWKRRS